MTQRQAVMVIEPDQGLLGDLVSFLTAEGFAAEGVPTGMDGLTRLGNRSPSLVVADLALPDMPGVELLAAIRRTSGRIPVLFLAGPGQAGELAAILRAGAYGVIPKPLGDLNILLHGIQSALSHAHLLEENDRLRVQLAAAEQSHTEQLRLQEKLFRTEKATAIGRLASSVAHDLNNVLTVMSGFAQCLKAAVSPGTITHDYAERIANAAGRVVEMTEQLSQFGRAQLSVHVSTDINRMVGEVARLLSRTIDKRITLHTAPHAEKPWVLADPARLQLALLNLGVSAGHAMSEGGGTLTCETRNLRVDAPARSGDPRALPAGDYVEVAIRDTGGNMDQEAARKAFDPLCGSKPLGYATELGLCGVQNCVREHHGELSFRARPGEHRAIILRLPVADAAAPAESVSAEPDAPRFAGHILLADDEEMIRTFVEQSLTGMGYTVTICRDGAAAVEHYARHADSIDLVILDLNMPRLSGLSAFQRIQEINPAAKVLLCTGQDDSDAASQFKNAGGAGVLAKPFRLVELSKLVTQIMGR